MRKYGKALTFVISLAALGTGLGVLLDSGAEAEGKGPPLRLRQFYLTPDQAYDGTAALTACAPGFHMASMWEILDPSNLRYSTELGATDDDSGWGPPADFSGWIRTGNGASGLPGDPGRSNCLAWESNDSGHHGTDVELPQSSWSTREADPVSPWQAGTTPCNIAVRVWCVEDLWF
jgi:hypothetical protein